ncbi:MAG: NAD(P)H-dependent oxidoreductase subunit E [Anaerolineales bacterium]|nr:NAD(P)H-dependent oxidoreductase subunit E [Anaerolineales bacterium]MDW8161500.1 NAD(P)H-dependent oxidoreductase subunit E [Anaerolineales bacterium]
MDHPAFSQLLQEDCDRSHLVPLLQRIQQLEGYISEQSVRQIARLLKISENHIYGVASFYSQFRFHKPGKHHLKVCLGTACHVQGGAHLAREIQKQLNLRSGETTPDGSIDYEEVACLGCCAQAAVVVIDGVIHAKMTPDRLLKKIDQLRGQQSTFSEAETQSLLAPTSA